MDNKLKIGDRVKIRPEEINRLGELEKFDAETEYIVENISEGCVKKLSGKSCTLHFDRFYKINKSYSIFN